MALPAAGNCTDAASQCRSIAALALRICSPLPVSRQPGCRAKPAGMPCQFSKYHLSSLSLLHSCSSPCLRRTLFPVGFKRQSLPPPFAVPSAHLLPRGPRLNPPVSCCFESRAGHSTVFNVRVCLVFAQAQSLPEDRYCSPSSTPFRFRPANEPHLFSLSA